MNDFVADLAKMIDHSVLHPTLTDEDLRTECQIAMDYKVASVCVKPYAVEQTVRILDGSEVLPGCVVGFPAGNNAIRVKVFEAIQAIQDGAKEIDMVVNIGKVLGKDWDYIEREIQDVTEACHLNRAIVKVIFETDFVTDETDKIRLCEICTKVGADFVKTSTGFGFVKQPNGFYKYTGATIEDIRLMRKHSGPSVKVKAAGGVRSLDDLLAVREAGADRCGATATVQIIE
ncbi:MAG: deoxyribose-phosphate aldolase, partial [Marinilabiliaceae bacterium]